MSFRNLFRCRHPLRRTLTSLKLQQSEPILKVSSKSFLIDEHRERQLERLNSLKPSEFSPSALNQLIVDFLTSPDKPDLNVAGKLINLYLFKIKTVEHLDCGDLVSFYILKLLEAEKIKPAVELLKDILQSMDQSKTSLIDSFLFESVWKAIIETKSDEAGADLLKTCLEMFPKLNIDNLLTTELTERLLIQLFLPRLNWTAVDLLISNSVVNDQITLSASILKEIFHVVLNPVPDDPYYDPLDREPFSGNIINHRFHRLIELLERWKHQSIPIKGTQIAKALEDIFKTFLPTDPMMESLQKLI